MKPLKRSPTDASDIGNWLVLIPVVLSVVLSPVLLPAQTTGAVPCNQGPIIPPSAATQDLDEDAGRWGAYCEGDSRWAKENVAAPSLDGNALRGAYMGGAPYSTVHFYQNLLPDSTATVFTLTLSFWFRPETMFNNQGAPSLVQALEFTMNKWEGGKRYEWALQWQNVGDGAPQWRYWNPHQPEKWIGLGVPGTLEAEQWHTLILEGEIDNQDQVHYKAFTLDDQTYRLDVTVPPADTPGEVDRLAVAVQLDGNFQGSAYELFLDKVRFVRQAAPTGAYDPVYLRIKNALRPWTFHGRPVRLVPLMDDPEKPDFKDVYHLFPAAIVLILTSGAGDLEIAHDIAEFFLLLYEYREEHPELLDVQGRFNGFPEVYKDLSGSVALRGDIGKDPNLAFRGTGPTVWLGVGLLNYLQALMDKSAQTAADLQQQERLFALCEAIGAWLTRLQVEDPDHPWLDGGIIGALDERTGEIRLGPFTESNAAAYGFLRKLAYLERWRDEPYAVEKWTQAADRLGAWFQWVIEEDTGRVYVGRTPEGHPVEGLPGQVAEAVDTYGFLILAGVVDDVLATQFLDRLLQSEALKEVVDASGRLLRGLAFGPQGDTIYWGPHGQVALAARLIRHPRYDDLLQMMQAGVLENGLPVFVRPAGLADQDQVRDWTGQPGDRAWVGDLVPAPEPSAWLAMQTNTPVDFNPFSPIVWNPVVVGEEGRPVCLGDFDGGGEVDFSDFFWFADAFNMKKGDADWDEELPSKPFPATPYSRFDLNGDEIIDFNDFFLFADRFGQSCNPAARGAFLPEALSPATLQMHWIETEGGTVLELCLADGYPARGLGMILRFDPNRLRYRQVEAIDGLALIAQPESDLLVIGYRGQTADPIPTRIHFEVLGGEPAVEVVEAAVRETNGQVRRLAMPDVARVPGRFGLEPNYPNPFNPETTLRYQLPEEIHVRLEIYNMLGQRIRTLMNQHQEAGYHQVGWDSRDEHGQEMTSGVYLCRLQAGAFTAVRRLVLIQ